jgi:hypothetical protein
MLRTVAGEAGPQDSCICGAISPDRAIAATYVATQ